MSEALYLHAGGPMTPKARARGMRQDATFHCEDCGQIVAVERLTPYLFRAPCACDRIIAWATKDPPPDWHAQRELFA